MVHLFTYHKSISTLYIAVDSCSIVPVYRDFCDSDFQSCIGRLGRTTDIQLRCAASDDNNQYRYEWFNTPDLTDSETISYLDPVVIGSDLQISASSTGYWWCKITDEILNVQSCSSFLPAIHVYPCTCLNASFSPIRICPTSRVNCDNINNECRSQVTFLCLRTTSIQVQLPLSTIIGHFTPETTENAPGTTEMKATNTLGTPYHSSSNAEHDVTTIDTIHFTPETTENAPGTTEMKATNTLGTPYHSSSNAEHDVTTIDMYSIYVTTTPSGTVVEDNNADVLPLLYILGPIVLVTLSSILLLLICIVCINHRRKKISIGSKCICTCVCKFCEQD